MFDYQRAIVREVPATLTLWWPQSYALGKESVFYPFHHGYADRMQNCTWFRYHTETCLTCLFSVPICSQMFQYFVQQLLRNVDDWIHSMSPCCCSCASVEKQFLAVAGSRCCRRQWGTASAVVPLKQRGPVSREKKRRFYSLSESAEIGIRCQQNWRFELFELSNRQENWGGLL